MSDEYEQGYQDAQMDIENELIKEIRTSTRQMELNHSMGHTTMTVTLVLTSYDRLYNIIFEDYQTRNQRNQLSTPLENFKKRTCDPLATTNSEANSATASLS